MYSLAIQQIVRRADSAIQGLVAAIQPHKHASAHRQSAVALEQSLNNSYGARLRYLLISSAANSVVPVKYVAFLSARLSFSEKSDSLLYFKGQIRLDVPRVMRYP